MADSVFSTFSISGQGLGVQRQRLTAIADNIANANTTRAEDGNVYRRKVVITRGLKQNSFEQALEQSVLNLKGTDGAHVPAAEMGGNSPERVLKAITARDDSAPRLVFDPAHPDANADGYVAMPNVNIVTEMVEMISAQRGFEANTSVIQAAKNIARDSLDI